MWVWALTTQLLWHFLISQHVLCSEYLLMGSIKPKVNIKCCWCQSRSNLGGVWSDIEIKDWVKILTHHLLSFQISPLGRGPIKSLITRWRNRIPSKTTPTTLIQCRVFWDRKDTKSGRHLAPLASFPSLKSRISKSFALKFQHWPLFKRRRGQHTFNGDHFSKSYILHFQFEFNQNVLQGVAPSACESLVGRPGHNCTDTKCMQGDMVCYMWYMWHIWCATLRYFH